MKFAIEYIIRLADFITKSGIKTELVPRAFGDEEKIKLRDIYQNFRTKDYAAVKLIEDRTNQDIVAANAWVAIRAQQGGLDANLISS